MRIPSDAGTLGRYDDECERAFHSTRASVAVLLILNGRHGNGLSISTQDPELLVAMPEFLREIATNIEERVKTDQP